MADASRPTGLEAHPPSPDGVAWWSVDPQALDERGRRDLAIVRVLGEAGFDLADAGVATFAEELKQRCAGTLWNMKRDGVLFKKCASLGMRSLPSPPASWPGEARRVIAVTASIAAPRFITDKVIEWCPEMASLSTFAINTALFDFERVYRSFCREERPSRSGREVLDDDRVVDLFPAPEPGPEARVLDKVSVLEAVTLCGHPKLAEVLMGIARGLTRKQIADEIGVSVSSIYRMLEEFRLKLNDSGFAIKGRDDQ